MNSSDNVRDLATKTTLPSRTLGRTGKSISIFGLGGEGILRTHGEMDKAVKVIQRALDLGVTYCDTAPAYASSRDYYGAALGERRREIFLASKTHDRTRDGSLRLLEDSLLRLRTDYLDLWQLHDLRTRDDLERIFSRGGAMEALVQAREEGRVRYLGLTGHQDPAVLVEAMGRFEFDTILVALNAADIHRLSFIRGVLPVATRKGMGVIGMKVCAQGQLLGRGGLSMQEAVGYTLSHAGVSTVIIGCQTPEEVEENARIVRDFQAFGAAQMQALERRTREKAGTYAYYKRP